MELEIRNVKKHYRKKEVLTDVTLQVQEGSCVESLHYCLFLREYKRQMRERFCGRVRIC